MNNSIDSTPANDADHHFRLADRHARIPVSVKRILVATDLTEESQKTIHFGLSLAQRFGAHLTLLHVYKQSYAVQFVRGPNSSDEVWNDRMHFVGTLKLWEENITERYADCDTAFRDGEPAEEIARMAKERDVDLIVISTHHYNWLTRLAYGCDAERILRYAPCPILIVPTDNDKALETAEGKDHMPKLVALSPNEAYGATSSLRGISSFGNTRPKTLERRNDMRSIFDFRRSSSGEYHRWYGIEEDDMPAIDYAIIESVATAVKNYDVPWFKRLAANAHF
jgi:nucleotide-binding universal stress UspA family protein